MTGAASADAVAVADAIGATTDAGDDTGAAAPTQRGRPARTYVLWLLAITAIGLAVRLAFYWFAQRNTCGSGILVEGCGGDSWFYHTTANLLADGRGFISPTQWVLNQSSQPAADHPPLFSVILAAFSLVGLDSWGAHYYVVILIGTATVFVTGLATRDVFGERAGLVAALLVALDPNVWINDGNVLSETPAMLCAVLVIWAAYRCWYRRSIGYAVLVGVGIGALTLLRAESWMLVVFIGIPITLLRRDAPWRDRIVRLVVIGAAAVVTVLPWVTYNMTRFNNPVTLSTGGGMILANSNCDITYHGDRLGYWASECIPVRKVLPGEDQSDDEKFLQRVGVDYIKAHKSRVPVVMAARVGRLWNLYRPLQQVQLDYYEGRPQWASRIALVVFYPLVGLAIYGAVLVRRRRIPLSPLLGPIITVTVSAALTFGHARYRAPAEPALCILAAVAVAGLIGSASGAGASRRTPADPPARLPS